MNRLLLLVLIGLLSFVLTKAEPPRKPSSGMPLFTTKIEDIDGRVFVTFMSPNLPDRTVEAKVENGTMTAIDDLGRGCMQHGWRE